CWSTQRQHCSSNSLPRSALGSTHFGSASQFAIAAFERPNLPRYICHGRLAILTMSKHLSEQMSLPALESMVHPNIISTWSSARNRRIVTPKNGLLPVWPESQSSIARKSSRRKSTYRPSFFGPGTWLSHSDSMAEVTWLRLLLHH